MSDKKPAATEQTDFNYDYANKCDCSDDDNCGCSFPNNMSHDFDHTQPANQIGNTSHTISHEKIEIDTQHSHLEQDSICICSPDECDCVTTSHKKIK